MTTMTETQNKPQNLSLATKPITYPYCHWNCRQGEKKPSDSTIEVKLDFIAKGNRIYGDAYLDIPIYRLTIPFMYDFYDKRGDEAKLTGLSWCNEFGLNNGAICFGKNPKPAIHPHNWGMHESPYALLFFTDAKEAAIAFEKVCTYMMQLSNNLYNKWEIILEERNQHNNFLNNKNQNEFEIASQLKNFFSNLGL